MPAGLASERGLDFAPAPHNWCSDHRFGRPESDTTLSAFCLPLRVPRDGYPVFLDFVPVTSEDFDIVLNADAAGPLISALRETTVQSSLDDLGGYDLPRTGSVEFLSQLQTHAAPRTSDR